MRDAKVERWGGWMGRRRWMCVRRYPWPLYSLSLSVCPVTCSPASPVFDPKDNDPCAAIQSESTHPSLSVSIHRRSLSPLPAPGFPAEIAGGRIRFLSATGYQRDSHPLQSIASSFGIIRLVRDQRHARRVTRGTKRGHGPIRRRVGTGRSCPGG